MSSGVVYVCLFGLLLLQDPRSADWPFGDFWDRKGIVGQLIGKSGPGLVYAAAAA